MRKKISVLVALLVITSTVSVFGWINALTRASLTIKMSDSASPNITISSTKTGTYGNSVSGTSTFNIAPCISTDGISFIDENGNASNQYARLLFYVKGDSSYTSLYVDDVTITPATDGVKVAVEYDSLATILNTASFSRTKLNKTVEVNPKAVKVRVWFDGNTITSPITDDISIAVDFSAE